MHVWKTLLDVSLRDINLMVKQTFALGQSSANLQHEMGRIVDSKNWKFWKKHLNFQDLLWLFSFEIIDRL